MSDAKTPRISVVMSTYNTEEKYLREAIQSILNQTFQDFEFIILNNASTNNTEEIIRSYNDPRIHYVKNETNLGISRSLNKGLDVAKGEFIARMDDDDISLPHRFQRQIAYFEKNPTISCTSSWAIVIPENRIIKQPENIRFLDMIKGNVHWHPSVMFRRAEFEKYGLRYHEDYLYAEDYELWMRVYKVLEMRIIQEDLIHYRMHESNVSKMQNTQQAATARRIQEEGVAWLASTEEDKQSLRGILFGIQKTTQKKIYLIYLFNILKILRIKEKGNKTKYYLFGFIPILKKKVNETKIRYYLFTFIPLMKIKIKKG